MKCKKCKKFVRFGNQRGKKRYKCIVCGCSTTKKIKASCLVDRRKTNSGNPKGNKKYSKEFIKEIIETTNIIKKEIIKNLLRDIPIKDKLDKYHPFKTEDKNKYGTKKFSKKTIYNLVKERFEKDEGRDKEFPSQSRFYKMMPKKQLRRKIKYNKGEYAGILNIEMPFDELMRFDLLCQMENLSRSNMALDLMADYVKKNDKKKK